MDGALHEVEKKNETTIFGPFGIELEYGYWFLQGHYKNKSGSRPQLWYS